MYTILANVNTPDVIKYNQNTSQNTAISTDIVRSKGIVHRGILSKMTSLK